MFKKKNSVKDIKNLLQDCTNGDKLLIVFIQSYPHLYGTRKIKTLKILLKKIHHGKK